MELKYSIYIYIVNFWKLPQLKYTFPIEHLDDAISLTPSRSSSTYKFPFSIARMELNHFDRQASKNVQQGSSDF